MAKSPMLLALKQVRDYLLSFIQQETKIFFFYVLGMVSYKGGLIDIEKLMEQMKRSEKARDETEQLLVDLRKTNTELVASNTRSKDKIKDLQSNLKSSNRKLNDTEQQLSSVNVS